MCNTSVTRFVYIGEDSGNYGNSANAVVEKLAKDLSKDFPGLKGFSRANVFNMRQ